MPRSTRCCLQEQVDYPDEVDTGQEDGPATVGQRIAIYSRKKTVTAARQSVIALSCNIACPSLAPLLLSIAPTFSLPTILSLSTLIVGIRFLRHFLDYILRKFYITDPGSEEEDVDPLNPLLTYAEAQDQIERLQRELSTAVTRIQTLFMTGGASSYLFTQLMPLFADDIAGYVYSTFISFLAVSTTNVACASGRRMLSKHPDDATIATLCCQLDIIVGVNPESEHEAPKGWKVTSDRLRSSCFQRVVSCLNDGEEIDEKCFFSYKIPSALIFDDTPSYTALTIGKILENLGLQIFAARKCEIAFALDTIPSLTEEQRRNAKNKFKTQIDLYDSAHKVFHKIIGALQNTSDCSFILTQDAEGFPQLALSIRIDARYQSIATEFRDELNGTFLHNNFELMGGEFVVSFKDSPSAKWYGRLRGDLGLTLRQKLESLLASRNSSGSTVVIPGTIFCSFLPKTPASEEDSESRTSVGPAESAGERADARSAAPIDPPEWYLESDEETRNRARARPRITFAFNGQEYTLGSSDCPFYVIGKENHTEITLGYLTVRSDERDSCSDSEFTAFERTLSFGNIRASGQGISPYRESADKVGISGNGSGRMPVTPVYKIHPGHRGGRVYGFHVGTIESTEGQKIRIIQFNTYADSTAAHDSRRTIRYGTGTPGASLLYPQDYDSEPVRSALPRPHS